MAWMVHTHRSTLTVFCPFPLAYVLCPCCRVVKPGGLVVLTDSVQMGDRPVWDKTLGNFGNLNEPHYRCVCVGVHVGACEQVCEGVVGA
jgi:hypothetical protein